MSFRYRDDFGLYWPDYDHKPEACHARCRRRVTDVDLAVALLDEHRRRVVIQAGGHAGIWPLRLATMFEKVYTFECEPILFQCLLLNCHAVDNITPSSFALGAARGEVKMRPAASAGSWRITDDGTLPVKQIAIDDLELGVCDALILDIEGREAHAIAGAKQTIARCNPVIMVEMLPSYAEVLSAQLTALHYREVRRIHGDAIFVRD